MSDEKYIPKVGDRVEVISGPNGAKMWVGYVGKVISVRLNEDGGLFGICVYNPKFKEEGHSLDSWVFPDGRLKKCL